MRYITQRVVILKFIVVERYAILTHNKCCSTLLFKENDRLQTKTKRLTIIQNHNIQIRHTNIIIPYRTPIFDASLYKLA